MRSLAIRILADLRKVLDRQGVRWYVFGAQAVNVWGRPRMTADVDVTIEPTDRPNELIRQLSRSGFEPVVEMTPEFVAHSPVFPFIHRETGMPLDIVVGRSGLEERFLERVVFVSLEGEQLPIIAPGDLIVLKLIAGRPKDIEDARGIVLAKRDELDAAAVRSLLTQVEMALDQSDLVKQFDAMLP